MKRTPREAAAIEAVLNALDDTILSLQTTRLALLDLLWLLKPKPPRVKREKPPVPEVDDLTEVLNLLPD